MLSGLLGELARAGTQDEIWDATVERVSQAARTCDGMPTPGTYTGPVAHKGLLRYHEEAVRWATRMAQRFSPPEWLFYLRRSSGVFEANDHPTTAGYCQVVAEALSLRSRARPPTLHLGDPSHAYGISEEVAHAILRFAEAVVLVYELHGTLRWAGKGAPVEFRIDAQPVVHPSTDLEAAVRLCDRRLGGNLLASLGVLSEPFPDQRSLGTDAFLPLWFGVPEPVPLPLLDGSGEVIEAWFIFRVLHLDRAPHLAYGSARLDETDVALIAVLLGAYFEKFIFGPELGQAARVGYMHLKPPALRGWLAYGLDVVSTGMFGDLINAEMIPGSPERAIEVLNAIPPEVFPPKPGSPVRRTGLGYTLDLEGASWSLITRFRRLAVVGGPVANVRAHTFEEQVQEMIDQTPIRPRREWRPYRGRIVRIAGEQITDIDALFEHDGHLVLVNCKSVPDSDDLERGDWRAIRNTVSRIHDDVAAWELKVDQLRQHPTGDNYDFTGASTIDALVVYPKAYFVPLGRATREVLAGLPVVVGASELSRWAEEPYDILRSERH